MPMLQVTPDILDQGRQLLDRTLGHVPASAGRYGPPQPPWEELHGETFSRDMVGALTPDALGRDDFSTDTRVASYDYLMAAYELNRHRPVYPPIWQPPGLYLMSGDQGDGKTMTAAEIGVLFVLCGWPSFSVNGGLCFGKVLLPHQVYAFADYITRGAFGFGDEFHSIYGRYEGQTVRGRTMAQGTAGFRKELIWFFGASSREWLLGGDIKSSIRGVGYPFQDYPAGGNYTFPPWAYRGATWYYPDPWRGTQYRELHDKGQQHREPCRRWTEYHRADSLYRAAKHYVSWEKIILDFGGKLGADAFRNSLDDRTDKPDPGEEQIGMEILSWYEDGYFDDAMDSYRQALTAGTGVNRGTHLLHLEDLALRYQELRGVKLGETKLGRALRAVKAEPSSKSRIPVQALAQAVEELKGQTAAALNRASG